MIITPSKPPSGAINSVENLARALDVPATMLETLAGSFDDRYIEIEKPATLRRRARTVYNPCDDLKFVQKRINARLFRQVGFGSYLFGGISDTDNPRDYIYCAQEHCPAGVIAKVDIKKFFDSILFDQIEEVFLNFFHYEPTVAELLTRLTSIHEYNLPQGAPTSVALANLVFHKTEPKLAKALAAKGFRYTRFIDDIVISHNDSAADIDPSRMMVEQMIIRSNFVINENEDKTIKRCRATNTINIFGIRVNGSQPRLPKPTQKNLRAAVHQLEHWATKPNERKSELYRKQWHHVSGLLAKLKRTKNKKYNGYRRRLRRIMPLEHERNLNSIKAQVRRLVTDSESPQNRSALLRRYNLLSAKAGVIKRSHTNLAAELRAQLNHAKKNIENN